MNKTVLITGATSGIGEDCARYLSCKGYDILIIGRNKEKLDALKAEFKDRCINSFQCDLTENEAVDAIFSEIKDKKIFLDGLIHCAGIDSFAAPVRMIKNESVEKSFSLHTEVFVKMCKSFYRKEISNEGSSIIAISSLASLMCQRNSLDYSVSKAALNAAVKVISKEFIKRGIRVNAILPANVDTPMCDNLKKMGNIEDIQPMGFIEPRYVSFMVEYLLSDKSKYMTGELIPISAGMEY